MEFFEPLCDLFENKITVDVEDMELQNYSVVPSLCEICLRAIQKRSICE